MEHKQNCRAVSGIFCDGEIQGTFAQKQFSCLGCEFFQIVREEEKDQFMLLKSGRSYERNA